MEIVIGGLLVLVSGVAGWFMGNAYGRREIEELRARNQKLRELLARAWASEHAATKGVAL